MDTKINTLYIVDDDEIIIYLTDKLLKKVDFADSIEKFTDAGTALKRLEFALQVKENVPDVILFDLNMPEMNGWEFLEQFRKLNTGIPVFVFTSSIDPLDKIKSESYEEVKDFIVKPLTRAKLNKIFRLITE